MHNRTEERADLIRGTLRHCAAGVPFAAFLGLFINALNLMMPLCRFTTA
jgi:hypothetical protein